MNIHSFALGTGSRDAAGNWLELYYPAPLLAPAAALVAACSAICNYQGGNQLIELDQTRLHKLQEALRRLGEDEQAEITALMQDSRRPLVAVFLAEDSKPASVAEVYLKLHLISHRLCRPHSLNLDGMFALLPNVAWTSAGAIALDELPKRQLEARLSGQSLTVHCVDKFPRMSDYVVPSGVRIADTARVRLGAYLGEGTTVMHEGFVNFNAGTLGKAMIEGRISAGVVLDEGSDLGGGASIMGSLSGGGKEVIAVGRDCLIGANAGIGISLGDRCIVEAGLYVTAGTKVSLLDENNQSTRVVKARELSGQHDLLFRRNSQSGAVECKTHKKPARLNEALHAHN